MELAGAEVETIWHGRRIRAFVPTLLSERDLALDAPTAAKAAAAAADVSHATESLEEEDEPLARLLLRSEGVASSFIEGVTAPIVDVVLAEEHLVRDGGSAAAWVAANLAAIDEALGSADIARPLTVSMLNEWHRTLMTGSPTPERFVGKLREEQGWIGGTSPLDAHLVTPPWPEVPRLIEDLLAYVNRTDVDPVAQAAVSHAQFEIIHPFADGNGRLGRVLVAWILTRRLALLVPPPFSVAIAADVAAYSAGLVLFGMGEPLPWIQWFADVVAQGARAQQSLISSVEALKRRFVDELSATGMRKDAAAFAALELLPRHLILTSPVIVRELGLSRKAAVAALRRLAEVGILTEYGTVRRDGPGHPAALYVSRDLLGLAGSSPLRSG